MPDQFTIPRFRYWNIGRDSEMQSAIVYFVTFRCLNSWLVSRVLGVSISDNETTTTTRRNGKTVVHKNCSTWQTVLQIHWRLLSSTSVSERISSLEDATCVIALSVSFTNQTQPIPI